MESNGKEIKDDGSAAESGGSGHTKTRLNRFTLLCALLASTNSILLGYGESICQISFLVTFFFFLWGLPSSSLKQETALEKLINITLPKNKLHLRS